MERVYLLLGQSAFLVKQRIKLLQQESSIDAFNILTYDALDTEINDVLQELTTVSFFGDMKMIIIENIDSFNRYEDSLIKSFISYLQKPSDDIILVLSAQKLNQSTSLDEALMKYTYIENIEDLKGSALPLYIKQIFTDDGYKIDSKSIEEIINRVGEDLFLLHQEIEKLKVYQIYDKVIEYKDVDLLVSRTLEDNIFAFSTAFLGGDVKLYMQIYNDLIISKMQPTQILNHLFNTIHMIQLTQTLLKEHYNQEQIATQFKISNGRAYYLIKEAREQSTSKVDQLIKAMADLDYKIKSGQIEDKVGLELLLLGGIR
jgi:DNA polymerase-3 subunit delta